MLSRRRLTSLVTSDSAQSYITYNLNRAYTSYLRVVSPGTTINQALSSMFSGIYLRLSDRHDPLHVQST